MRIYTLVLLGAAACADQGPPTPQQQAETYFDEQVYPVLVQQCQSCHTSDGVAFMGTDAGSTYVDLTTSALTDNFSNSAPFMTTMENGNHFGGPSGDAMSVFEQWFALEQAAR
ncbi:MAG TPA: hypothetical protein VMJ10_26870 [Kofleriaceae bacterium]|nr:hypothetical protein [Kofleriaceae bacterium]